MSFTGSPEFVHSSRNVRRSPVALDFSMRGWWVAIAYASSLVVVICDRTADHKAKVSTTFETVKQKNGDFYDLNRLTNSFLVIHNSAFV